ncbi:unnamed protein product [Thlaspi arvense]|uniref:Uncharacterized protein n=1 Tax=Thlaspi arvense TaxID=13288 RepID=A0AAU9T721_THLAR|nr:unnamed protein product [Thlaspi arvense]
MNHLYFCRFDFEDMDSSPLLATSLPQKQLTTSSSAATATVGWVRLPPPQKFAFLIDRSESVAEVLQIHAAILRHNLLLHRYPVLNLKLQRAYASHGKIRHSLALFHQTIDPDLFLFTAAINTASTNGLHDQSFLLYVLLLSSQIVPNEFTFSSILKSCSRKPKPDERTVVAALTACSQIGALESGRWIHLCLSTGYRELSRRHLHQNTNRRNQTDTIVRVLLSLETVMDGKLRSDPLIVALLSKQFLPV